MRSTCLFLGLLAWVGPAFSEILTPDQAAEYAIANNPGLRAVQEQSLAAGENRLAASSGHKPRVIARYSLRHSNNPLDAFADKLNTRSVASADFDPAALNDPDPSTLNIAELGVRLPIYSGGRVSAEVRQAEETEIARRLQYERAKQETAAQVRQAYLALQTAQRGLAVTDDAVAAAEGHANTTARLQRAGRIVASDTLTAEVNLAAVKGLREQALARVRQAENQLKLVMGMPLGDSLQVEVWTLPAQDENAHLQALEDSALSRRKDLMALASQVNAARAQVDVARAEGKTQVDIMATTNWYDRGLATDNNSWNVMGVVSRSLYDGGGTRHRARAAHHEAGALQAQMYSLEQRVRADVRAAYNDVLQAQARLALATGNVDRANRTVALVKKRYGEARTILIDLLQAERALVEARNEQLNAAFALGIGRIDLQLATGEFPDVGGVK